MKPAINITTAIFASILAAGLASAQSPSVIQNTRNTMNGVSNQAAAASNDALGLKQPGVHQTVPAAGSAKPAAAKSSGVAVVTPSKSTAPSSAPLPANKTGAKNSGATKRIPAVASRHSVPPKPASVAPQSNPQGAATLADNGAAGSGEGEHETEQPVTPDSKTSANGRRDPFLSPVVTHTGGPSCSTGKKCLEIGTINLRGVVHAESGFIAVVSNGLNKAYFLRENDPVFNGYVMRITGDSIVFQETLQDRLGKSFTREVVKKITAPAV
jgi:hypothetical protein